jgi:hypothetical protein
MPGVNTPAAGYDPATARKSLLASSSFRPEQLVPLAFRPLDDWWVYWEAQAKLFNRPRPEFFAQVWPGNVFLAASQTGRKGGFNEPTVVDKLGDLHLQDPWSQFFPLWIRKTDRLHGNGDEPNVNHLLLEALCQAARVRPYAADGHTWTAGAKGLAQQVFFHALAILWSPAYRSAHAESLRQDWPRIPIPAQPKALKASAAAGRAVADLLLPDVEVRGVTIGKLRPELRDLAVPAKVGGGPLDPTTDLIVDIGWGFRGQRAAVMCGKGRSEPHASAPNDAIDVYINSKVHWSNVPKDVWEMTIGGYPVVKKWLSYRERKVLGRPLRLEEMTYVAHVVRRLKALLLLGEELDQNYRACSQDTLEGIASDRSDTVR